jgi:hypothetical protein
MMRLRESPIHTVAAEADRSSMPLESLLTAVPFGSRVGWTGRSRLAIASLGVALLLAGCDSGSDPALTAPGVSNSGEPGLETPVLSLEARSEGGHYRIGARPAAPPVSLHEMHDWIVRIERMEGSSELPTTVLFDGGMPSHGHGFVTRPRVTQNLGDGEFLVEGVKFHMPGPWMLRITVKSHTGSDQVALPVTITP